MNLNALQSSGFFVEYPNAGTPIDLIAASQTPAAAPVNAVNVAGSPCERIQVRTAGTLIVKRDRDNGVVTLTFADNEVKWVRCRTIDGGTAVGITVFWP